MQEYKATISDFFLSATARLTLTYLAIIMVMSIGFTTILYSVSASHLERRLPPTTQMRQGGFSDIFDDQSTLRDKVEAFLQRRVDQEKAELAWQLVAINCLVLALGAIISYFLARKTLDPIEKAMISKDQFISDASHELRTPLTALQTTNEVALRRKKLSASEARELLSENLAEVKRLQYLTDGLLGLLKHNTPGVRDTVNIQEVIGDAMNQVIHAAQAKHITIEDTVPSTILRTDPVLVTQVVTILLENAIKYSPDKSTITISAKKDKKKVQVSVRDTGIGIKANDIEHIFDRFYRADQSRTRLDTAGYGLGLAIAKKLITSLDGDIRVKSKSGKGSEFIISLPM